MFKLQDIAIAQTTRLTMDLILDVLFLQHFLIGILRRRLHAGRSVQLAVRDYQLTGKWIKMHATPKKNKRQEGE
jgi:hypothetical protein